VWGTGDVGTKEDERRRRGSIDQYGRTKGRRAGKGFLLFIPGSPFPVTISLHVRRCATRERTLRAEQHKSRALTFPTSVRTNVSSYGYVYGRVRTHTYAVRRGREIKKTLFYDEKNLRLLFRGDFFFRFRVHESSLPPTVCVNDTRLLLNRILYVRSRRKCE